MADYWKLTNQEKPQRGRRGQRDEFLKELDCSLFMFLIEYIRKQANLKTDYDQ